MKTQIIGKNSCLHGLKNFVVLKCPYYPKLCTDSIDSLSKSQWQFFFSEVEKDIQKFIWNLKKPQIAKTMLNKRNKEIGWCPHIS